MKRVKKEWVETEKKQGKEELVREQVRTGCVKEKKEGIERVKAGVGQVDESGSKEGNVKDR